MSSCNSTLGRFLLEYSAALASGVLYRMRSLCVVKRAIIAEN